MKSYLLTVLSTSLFFAAVSFACGTTNYWDNNGADAGFGVAGGVWGIDGNWSDDSTGESVATVTNTTATDHLCFGTDSDGLTAGAITVSGSDQAFSSMTFGQASGPIVLSNGTLNLAAPASTIALNNSSNTINSALTATAGLIMQGEAVFEQSYKSYLTTNATVIFPNTQLA